MVRAKKARIDNGAWQLIRMNPSHMEILQSLIPKPEEPSGKKRGRPAGNKNKVEAGIQDGTDQTPKPKRRRGRPLGSKNKPKVTGPKHQNPTERPFKHNQDKREKSRIV